ncbi:MAG TPA: glycosyltransferase [Luteimonas sp.]
MSPDALAGLGFVYFGNDWFAENRTSSHHVAARIARIAPLLYVDSPGMRRPDGSRRDLKRGLRKLLAAFRRPIHVEGNLWHCTVPQLPFRGIPGMNAFNRWFGQFAVRRAMRAIGLAECISWFVVPHPGFLANRLGESLSVYYCIDDYAAHPGVDADHIGRLDAGLTKAADLVFVAPPTLLEAKKALNPCTFPAPHGVDAGLFAQASDPATEVPGAIADIRHPVVGYHGSIHEWIDLPLIEWLATQRPDWTFLLVGHAAVDVSRLERLPNVVLAGAQPYASLPRWARAYDVAIIPYRMTRQVANANPLKLREYLATGKPVVSAWNAEIDKFSQWIRIARDRQGFLDAIAASLADDTDRQRKERMAAVASQTWERRVEAVLAEVRLALERKHPRSARTPHPHTGS